MTKCECHHVATTKKERKTLTIALILNAAMFIIGLIAGILAQSTALVADSFDMLADALVYLLGLLAIGRIIQFKIIIARFSSGLLSLLGVGILFEVGHRFWLGSSPEGSVMISVATLSLIVNTIVLMLLRRFKEGEIHLRVTWIFTRADIIVNLGVIFSGILVMLTKSHYPDLIVGFTIGLYVIRESIEIFKESLMDRVHK